MGSTRQVGALQLSRRKVGYNGGPPVIMRPVVDRALAEPEDVDGLAALLDELAQEGPRIVFGPFLRVPVATVEVDSDPDSGLGCPASWVGLLDLREVGAEIRRVASRTSVERHVLQLVDAARRDIREVGEERGPGSHVEDELRIGWRLQWRWRPVCMVAACGVDRDEDERSGSKVTMRGKTRSSNGSTTITCHLLWVPLNRN